MHRPPDPALCPLCGEPNGCALAAAPGASPADCWCASRRFDAELLARVPPAAAGRACVCSRCQRAAPRAGGAG
jgi:hypothetical protein